MDCVGGIFVSKNKNIINFKGEVKIMYKLIQATFLLFVFSFCALAQTAEEYNKNEFYVGYSNQQVGSVARSTFNGVEGSYTRNVSRYFGIRSTLSFAKDNRTLQGSVLNPEGGTYNFRQDNNRSVYNFLAGVQVKDNASTKRLKPFGYALGGVAHNRNTFKNLACVSSSSSPSNCPSTPPIFDNVTFSDTGLAGAFGGGLDIKINDRIDFRAIQADYNPIYSNSRVNNNFRFSVGIVIK